MVVKTFRGLLADGAEERIRLSTIKGKVGYKIVKFELFPTVVGSSEAGTEHETLVQIWKEASPSTPGVADFTLNSLLGAACYISEVSGSPAYVIGTNSTVVFDRVTFNQDIYITHVNNHTDASGINYYLELEVIPLDDAGAEYTTLKDMRT